MRQSPRKKGLDSLFKEVSVKTFHFLLRDPRTLELIFKPREA